MGVMNDKYIARFYFNIEKYQQQQSFYI